MTKHLTNIKPHQVCTRCVMDTTDPDIVFNEYGECNHCSKYISNKHHLNVTPEKTAELEAIVAGIKRDGVGKDFDCIIGVSGGVDSTYVAYLVKKFGLRPLAVHLDNGWNSELAVSNIEKTLEKLEIDLYTHVINWEEFKDLQKSFLKASTPGMEIPTDHGIWSILHIIAAKHNIKYIINGSNMSTEYIMARKWSESEGQLDWLLIKNVHKKFGSVKLKTFPHIGLFDLIYYKLVKKIRTINVLNYIEYSKKEAMRVLQGELGWIYYGGKHYESIYTRFTQGYIQPNKFNIDKRRAHFSNLICYGELTREGALETLKQDPYPSEEMLRKDTEFFMTKIGYSQSDFDNMMNAQTFSYTDYPGYFNNKFLCFLRDLGLRLHSFLKKTSYYGGVAEKI